ncbi:tetratricopeptide repeat protein [Methanocaldococcus sp.]
MEILNNKEKAREIYKKGVEIGNAGDVEKALEYFSKAIELDPLYKDAYFNKALALRMLGRLDEARDWFLKGLAIQEKLDLKSLKKKKEKK